MVAELYGLDNGCRADSVAQGLHLNRIKQTSYTRQAAMTSSFVDNLPKDLLVNVRSMCGSRGDAWLRSLSERIEGLETQWRIKSGPVYTTAGINFVAPAA